MQKRDFLNTLQSTGKLKYKRYTASPLRYPGGKSLAVGLIVETIPDHVKRIASPFIGGGSVEIALARELEMEVCAYDVFDILCAYWKVQLSAPDELARRLRKYEPNRETYAIVKKRLEGHWKGKYRLDPYDLAACYYFNFNTSYGPNFLGWPSSIYMNASRYSKMVDKAGAFQAHGLSVECASFEQSIARHSDDFLYCDPPYYLADGNTFCGMYPQRNFPIHHKGFQHETLRDMLLDHKAGFVLSYNDCPVIRDWYSDCRIETPEWQYTFGQGETRIGKYRKERDDQSHVKKSHELLIYKHPN